MFLRIDNLADRLEDLELIKKWLTQSQTSELLTKYCTTTNLDGYFERLGWTYKETAKTIIGNETNLYVKELE